MVAPAATHFYRYTTANRLDWLETIILNHRIYIPRPTQLNDPAEGRPCLALNSARDAARFFARTWRKNHPSASLEEIADTFGEISTGIARFGLDWIRRDVTTELHRRFEDLGIFSMSKRWNNMSMWAKYAANHTGYCLEFANADLFAIAREVEYGDVLAIDVTDDASMNLAFFFRKKADWSNEEEVRLLTPRHWPRTMTFDPALLTTIILGKDMAADHRAKIAAWAHARVPRLAVDLTEYDAFEHTLRRVSHSSIA